MSRPFIVGKPSPMSTIVTRDRRHVRRKPGPTFKALKAEWYAKLTAAGFEDIEEGKDYDYSLMVQHHMLDRRVVVRGKSNGAAELRAAIAELRNHAVHDSLFQRIVTGLAIEGLMKPEILKGLANQRNCTDGSVRWSLQNVHRSAAKLAERGTHIPAEDE